MKALREIRDAFKERQATQPAVSHSRMSPPKHAGTIEPPKLVIRATADYAAQHHHELTFHKGDFFHVIKEEPPQPGWIEACNPATNARGIVPVAYFDILNRTTPRTTPTLSRSSDHGRSSGASQSSCARSRTSNSSSSTGTSAATVATFKYDFHAELPHEMSAKLGQSVVVVARSNDEWLVAKPLDHIGTPGLIPTSFISFRDKYSGETLNSNDNELVLSQIPSLAEWEESSRRLREHAIPLGSLESTTLRNAQHHQTVPLPPKELDSPLSSSFRPRSMDDYFSTLTAYAGAAPALVPHGHGNSKLQAPIQLLPQGTVLSAAVESVHQDMNEYWYQVRAYFLSDEAPQSPSLAHSSQQQCELTLFRSYRDFVHLHESLKAELLRPPLANASLRTLLETFPAPPQHPYKTARQCCGELNMYMQSLCALSHIQLRSPVIRAFLDLRPGDQCRAVAPGSTPSTGEPLDSVRSPGTFDKHGSTQPSSAPHSQTQTGCTTPDRNSDHSLLTHYRIKVVRQDDETQLIALRMAPTMTRASLMLKIQERLGFDLCTLKGAKHHGGVPLYDDSTLHHWLEQSLTDGTKLLLYAGTHAVGPV